MKSENLEFIALFEASGWSQAYAATRLHKDRASINRYLNNKFPPEPAVIELFKLILACEQPGVLSPSFSDENQLAAWETKILEDLRPLHVEDRERVLRTIRAMIDGLPIRTSVSYLQKPTKKISSEKKGEKDHSAGGDVMDRIVDEIRAKPGSGQSNK